MPLNIAEGAGEYATDEKIRFYRMAKRSATECAGILDVCHRLELIGENQYVKGCERLIRIGSILVPFQSHPILWDLASSLSCLQEGTLNPAASNRCSFATASASPGLKSRRQTQILGRA